jgi:hypothetical protein
VKQIALNVTAVVLTLRGLVTYYVYFSSIESRRVDIPCHGPRCHRRPCASTGCGDIAPTIAELQAAGVTSLRGIAAALNERGIPTASGTGEWQAVQVRRVLARLPA